MSAIPNGFRFAVTSAGFRKNGRNDLALVLSSTPAVAAGFFTTNRFKAAPVLVGEAMLARSPMARAIVINSGQANACTGDEGLANCRASLRMVADALELDPGDILPASTGVIGAQLKMERWEKAVPALLGSLGSCGTQDFAQAIMTTDHFPKYSGASFTLRAGEVTVSGIAKGAGMICPNMATMLAVVLCDAEVEPDVWRVILGRAMDKTFNRVSVDGDTSTNDTLYGLANGASGVKVDGEEDTRKLEEALSRVLHDLAYMLVKDGEGATKVMHVRVHGAASDEDAEKAARTIAHSPLVKTAIHGKDANWGRIVAALGRSGAEFKVDEVRVQICGVDVFENGQPTAQDFDAQLKAPFELPDIRLDIHLGHGMGTYYMMASDLTHKYIDINASYRS